MGRKSNCYAGIGHSGLIPPGFQGTKGDQIGPFEVPKAMLTHSDTACTPRQAPRLLGFLLPLLLLTACAAPLRSDYLRMQAKAHDGALAPGDTVTIVESSSAKGESVTTRAIVGSDGQLDLGAMGKFNVIGRTPRSLRDDLARDLSLSSTMLSVRSQAPAAGRAFVFGKVSEPGRIALTQYSTLSAAVRQALPSKELADVRKIRLLRGQIPNEREMIFDLTQIERGGVDPILMDGDILVVPATPLGKLFAPMQGGDESPQPKDSQVEASED